MPEQSPLNRLREILAESGLSHSQFARAMGRDPRSLRRWLAGGTLPDAAVDYIARIVRVDVTRDRITLVLTR